MNSFGCHVNAGHHYSTFSKGLFYREMSSPWGHVGLFFQLPLSWLHWSHFFWGLWNLILRTFAGLWDWLLPLDPSRPFSISILLSKNQTEVGEGTLIQ